MFVWGELKCGSPKYGTVLHWRPPDVHIFGFASTPHISIHRLYCHNCMYG